MINIKLQKQLGSRDSEINIDVSLTLKKGELVALYGSSGAGKTSILRMIAGLLTPDNGEISVSGETWFNSPDKVLLPPWSRSVGIVFQDYALFPNMTVRENIAYAVADGNDVAIDGMLKAMELESLRDKKPAVLSGGQRQRVALGRALMRKPKLLLLDEPFAALDTSLRARMHQLVLDMHKQFDLTTILVTHDLIDVATLADRVFLLKNGRIERSGDLKEVVPYQQFADLLRVIEKKYHP